MCGISDTSKSWYGIGAIGSRQSNLGFFGGRVLLSFGSWFRLQLFWGSGIDSVGGCFGCGLVLWVLFLSSSSISFNFGIWKA